jgi:hypothetical protein
MSENLIVPSRDPGVVLTLRPSSRDYFIAEMTHPGVSAVVQVGTYLSDGLGNYFTSLATDWKGWPGERRWSSLEGELELSARCDRTGHVSLRVRLRRESPAEWQLDAQLVLEAGQLERLAHDARSFEGSALNVP